MSLLTIVQTACAELGLSQPSAVASATDLQTVQLFNLAIRVGKELVKAHEWTFLQKTYIVNLVAPVSTTGTTASASAIITAIPTTASITAATFVCSGNGIPAAARVQSVDSGTQVTLDSPATASATGVALLFAKDTYQPPTDFDRDIDATQWDRTNRWPLLGPSSPQEDEWHRSGVVTVGPRRHHRQVGISPNTQRYWPPPGTGDTPMEYAREYISKNWVAVSGGTTYAATFANDADTALFDEQVIILGLKAKFKAEKQFDFAPAQAEYLEYVSQLIAMDGPKATLSLAKRRFNPLISPANVQDGFFPAGVDTSNG